MPDYISVDEASKILGVSDRHVRRYCTEGKLKSEKNGKAYIIDLASVRKFLGSNDLLADSNVDPDIESGEESAVPDTARHTHMSASDPDIGRTNGNGHADMSVSDSDSTSASPKASDIDPDTSGNDAVTPAEADMSDPDELFRKTDELLRIWSERLAEGSQQLNTARDVLSQYSSKYSAERDRTSKVKSTLSHLLEELDQPAS